MSAGSHSKGPTASKRHVLFAVLDWGLGHATRTWPLILAARQSGAQVTVASRGAAAVWLQHRMHETAGETRTSRPALAQGPPWVCLEKPGVPHPLCQRPPHASPAFALQLPSLSGQHCRRAAVVPSPVGTELVFTHVVSDNCYGVYPHRCSIPSALITHQVVPPTPRVLRPIATLQVRKWATAFDEVWIPDTGKCQLAGRLSDPPMANHRFVGPLSRFALEDATRPAAATDADLVSPPLVGMVSGPEPQRRLMEEALIGCFSRDGRAAVVFSGSPHGTERRVGNVRVLPHAQDHQIRHALLHADCIVCRSGYTSLMDLATLQISAILVPTPGQPEQEYLARHWEEHWGWTTVQQDQLAAFEPRRLEPHPVPLPVPAGEKWSWFEDWLRHAPSP